LSPLKFIENKRGGKMNLGTIAFNKKIFNLDHMTSEELEELIKDMELDTQKKQKEIKKMLK